MACCNRVVFFPSERAHTHYQSQWFSRIHSFGSISLCFTTMPKEMLAKDKFTDLAGWEEPQEILLPNILHWSRLKVSGHHPDVFIFTSRNRYPWVVTLCQTFRQISWHPAEAFQVKGKLIRFCSSLNGHAKLLPHLHQSLPSCCTNSQPSLFNLPF